MARSARGGRGHGLDTGTGHGPGAPPYGGEVLAGASRASRVDDGPEVAEAGAGASTGRPGASVGLGAGEAIRRARMLDARRALTRGDVRGAVGLILEALGDGV